jgi:hypothetical protein
VPRDEPAKRADAEQDGEGDHEQDDRDRRGAFRILLDPIEEVDGGDLRLEGEVPRDQDDCPDLPDRARERHRDAGQDPREDARQHDAPESGEAARPERLRGVLELLVELDEHGLHGADDEGERDEQQRDVDRAAREGHVGVEVERADRDVERRAWPVERHDHEPRDDRR